MRRSVAARICAASALTAYAFLVRPRLRWWGSTREERERTWPGDEMAGGRIRVVSMRAITIDAPPAHVWPWLLQIGEDPVQHRFAGDTVWLPRTRLVVGYLEHNRAMILIAPKDWERQIHRKPIAAGTWAFILQPAERNRTRLLVRSVRAAAPLSAARLLNGFRELRQFFMERRMMQCIKTLAERSRSYRDAEEEPAGRRALRGSH